MPFKKPPLALETHGLAMGGIFCFFFFIRCKGVTDVLSHVMHFPSKLTENANSRGKLKVLGNLRGSIVTF